MAGTGGCAVAVRSIHQGLGMKHREEALPNEVGAVTSFEAGHGEGVCCSNACRGVSGFPTFLPDSFSVDPVALFIGRRKTA